ncbi:MAG: peptide deformylase [Rhodospirillaceae bacterium]
MTIQKIAIMGQSVLRREALPVSDLKDQELGRLITDMCETMRDAPGVGLAAPQLFAGLRVIVYRVPGDRGDDAEAVPETVLINPEIRPLDEGLALGWEGCLSLPGLRGLVPRYKRIAYRGLAPDGTPLAGEASGFHARVIQHEIDHLDGILYIDRIHDLRLLCFDSEAADFRFSDYCDVEDDV